MASVLFRAFRCAAVFALAGPPIGCGVLLLVAFVSSPRIEYLRVMIPAMVFAYFLAAVPALCTGFVGGLLEPWLLGWRHYVALGMLGAVIASVYAFVFMSGPHVDVPALLATWALPACISGTACARLYFGPPGNPQGLVRGKG